MKRKIQALTVGALFAVTQLSFGQLVLSGTNYTQNFDSIGTTWPAEWVMCTNASASYVGTPAYFNPTNLVMINVTNTAWSSSSGRFGNYAWTTNYDGTIYVGSESTTVQSNALNRCLGIRQAGSFGDPGAAFVLQISNTLGFGNFKMSVDLANLSPQGRVTIWTIDYGVGPSNTTFTPLGTYTNFATPTGVFGNTNYSFSFGSALDNQGTNVWIRVAALSGTTGSGSRSTFAIDNFKMSYSAVAQTTNPPSIISNPQSQAVVQGNNVNLVVQAGGTAPLGYQWYYNDINTPINGATDPSLTLTFVNTNQAGSYFVVVTNAIGAITSAPAVLTVTLPTPISTNIAYLRTLEDHTNWAPTNTTTLYTIQGIVTTYWNMTTSTNSEFFVQDGTGGIAVFISSGSTHPSAGDLVQVTGPLGQFDGLLELNLVAQNPSHSVTVVSSGNPLPTPIPLQSFTVTNNIAAMEALEGSLVVISNVFPQANPNGFQGNSTNYVTNLNGQVFPLYINQGVGDAVASTIPEFASSVVGVFAQFKTTAPYTNGYQIDLIRYAALTASTPVVPLQATNAGANVVVAWSAVPANFVLQSNSDLSSTNWQNVGTAPVVTNFQNLVTVPATNTQFFRLLRPGQ